MRASRSNSARPCVVRSTSASTIMFPGPVSNANTSLGLRVSGNHGHVGNPADIQRHAAAQRVAVKQIIGEWNQRRSLSAGRHVRRTKISDRRNPRSLGDEADIPELQRGRPAAPFPETCAVAPM